MADEGRDFSDLPGDSKAEPVGPHLRGYRIMHLAVVTNSRGTLSLPDVGVFLRNIDARILGHKNCCDEANKGANGNVNRDGCARSVHAEQPGGD